MIEYTIPKERPQYEYKTTKISDIITKYWFRLIAVYFMFHLFFKVTPPDESPLMATSPTTSSEKAVTAKASVPSLFDVWSSSATEKSSSTSWAKKIAKSPDTRIAFNTTKIKDAKKFIERFAGVALKEQEKYGIPAAVILARGILNSDCGTSNQSLENNHYFFRSNKSYETAWLNLRAHSKQLRNAAPKNPKSLKAWAAASESAFQDHITKQEIMAVIETMNLQLIK